jgi:hypothetical protein
MSPHGQITSLVVRRIDAALAGYVQRWESKVMTPADKKLDKDVKEGKIPKPIEDLPTEWAKEDREIEGGKPDLAELEEDPSGL